MSETDSDKLLKLADWMQMQAEPSLREWAAFPNQLRRIARKLAILEGLRFSGANAHTHTEELRAILKESK